MSHSEIISEIISEIMTCVVDYDDYERMVELGVNVSSSYAEFIAWNEKCIQELDADELTWTLRLCKRINIGNIRMMDLDPCAVFQATNIYFDADANLCIVNQC